MDEHVNDSDHLKSESKRTKSSRRKSFKQRLTATGSDDTSRSSSNVNIDRLLYLRIRFSSC